MREGIKTTDTRKIYECIKTAFFARGFQHHLLLPQNEFQMFKKNLQKLKFINFHLHCSEE